MLEMDLANTPVVLFLIVLIYLNIFRANSFAERLQLPIAVLHGEHIQEDSDKCDGRQSPPVPRRTRTRGMSESVCSELLIGKVLSEIFFHSCYNCSCYLKGGSFPCVSTI